MWCLAADVLDKSRLHYILTYRTNEASIFNLKLLSRVCGRSISFSKFFNQYFLFEQFFRAVSFAIKCTNQPNFSSFIGRIINSILFKRWFYLTFWKAGRADIFYGQILFCQVLSAYSWLGNDFLSQLCEIRLMTLRGIAS